MAKNKIPPEVKAQVDEIVANFNRTELKKPAPALVQHPLPGSISISRSPQNLSHLAGLPIELHRRNG